MDLDTEEVEKERDTHHGRRDSRLRTTTWGKRVTVRT
jgi:hypothetical protein